MKWHNDSKNQAHKDYKDQWNKECELLGLKPDSKLPMGTVNLFNKYHENALKRIDESYQSQKDDIYKLFE